MLPRRFRAAAFAALAFVALTTGCAQTVGDIDRTLDNKLEKSVFDGEWYMLQTVVDTNATATSTFAGLMGPMERIVFDFDRDYLFARRVHEDIVGMDVAATGIPDPEAFEGRIVAGWPVDHFDVQRQYNASTGEEQNVITENRSDREWYDRDYVRVNWDANFIETNVSWGFDFIETSGGMQITLSSEENKDNWFVEYDDNGEAYYIDIVTTYIADPDWLSCFLTVGFPTVWGTDCGPEEVEVRTSFLRLNERVEDQHVPQQFDDHDMNRFGYFRTNRCLYDDRFECTDDSRISVANLHDIWTNNRAADGTPLPYSERTPNPIDYYISYEYPTDLYDETFEMANQFDWAFRRTVAGAQGVSIDQVPRMFYICLNDGTAEMTEPPPELIASTYSEESLEQLRAFYAASAEGYRLGHCINPGERKNQGDLRYSFLNWRTDPAAPWYGYGPTAADPISGEAIQGVANFNGGHLNRHAQRILIYVNIMEGDVTAEEYGYGQVSQRYFENLRREADGDLYFGYDTTPGAPDDKDLDQIEVVTSVSADRILRAGRHLDENYALAWELSEDPTLQSVLSRPVDDFRLRNEYQRMPLQRIAGTHFEQMAIMPEMVTQLSQGLLQPGDDPSSLCPAGLGEYCEPANIMSPVGIERMRANQSLRDRMRDRWMENNVILAADLDEQVIGFARELYEYKRYLKENARLTDEEIEQELWSEIRGRIYTGIQAHEIGHTIGLRHNFAGTADALNYFPQYWTLRQKSFGEDCDEAGYRNFDPLGYAAGEVAPIPCSGAGPTAEDHARVLAEMRLGVVDDDTKFGSIDYYENSTVMDYHGEFTSRQGGLGLYDYAAVAYGYGELIEVFDNPPHKIEVRSSWDSEGTFQESTTTRSDDIVADMDDVENWTTRRGSDVEGDAPGDYIRDGGWDYWHYSVLPIMFYDDASELVNTEEDWAAYDPAKIKFEDLGPMSRMYDRSLVSVSDFETPGVRRWAERDVEVPYLFCSDHRRGTSSLCAIFDTGADEAEVVSRLIADYENYYPITWFRRARPAFGLSLWPVLSRLMNYTFDPAITQYQHWLLRAGGRGQGWYLNDNAGMASTLASQDALNFVSGVLATPTIGTYVPDPEDGGVLVNVDDDLGYRFPSYDARFGEVPDEDYVDLHIEDGARYGYTQFLRNEDEEGGFYYWIQYEVLSHFWAKYAALFSFTSGSVDIIGADTASDTTAFYLPPYIAFPDAIGNYFGALFSEQYGNFGGCVQRNEAGDWEYNNIDLLRSNTYRCDGAVLNPYTAIYGNRDFNMKYLSILFAAASFTVYFDYGWLDHSSVYIWGRGEQPAIFEGKPLPGDGEGAGVVDNEGYQWLVYSDEGGVGYAARYDATLEHPDGWFEGEIVIGPDGYSQGPNVGYRMVERAIELQAALDAALEAEADEDTPNPERDSGEIGYELDNHLEMMRYLVEINIFYSL